MPVLAKISELLRRRRLDADLTWHVATRTAERESARVAEEDAGRILREAALSQEEAYGEAIARILRQARSGHAS
jgi:hypothetical protein